MGISDRVQGFLDSWPIVKEQLEEVLKDNEGLFHSDRACRSLPGESQNGLQALVGKTDPGL
jgi:hypothetical protein